MQRRHFLQAVGSGAALLNTHAAPANAAPKQALMKAGTQHDSSDEVMGVMAAFGVEHICSTLPSTKLDEHWSVEGLTRLRERVESHGIKLDIVPLPMSSNYITKYEYPGILLGKSPDRDRDIDTICQMIRNAAKAGIPALKYNLNILGVVRTQPTRGRGGCQYSTFVYDEARQDPPLTEAGAVSDDAYWERITYFLERVIPVAEEHKVRMACHPHDPGMPHDKGYRGVHTVLGSVDGLKRFIEIQSSPYHGLNFCQGTVSEMLEDPGREIFDVIRYFGSRRKIFNVHFRNIRGRFLHFQETFPDDGDVNMIQVPKIAGDPGGRQAFAFAFGYIQALIQMVSQEG
jgi:mannonate dehydratase